MIEALTWASGGLVGLGVLFVCALAVRRVRLAGEERKRREAEERLRPLALALVEGERGNLPEPRGYDARALARILARYARQLSGAALSHIAAFFEARGDVAREIAELSGTRMWRRATAAHFLGDMGSTTAVPALLAALADPHRDVRAAAARSLGRLGVVEAVEPLVYSLVRGRLPRAVTAQALLSLGPPALPRLRSLLGQTEAEVKVFVVDLIGLLGNASDAPALTALLRDTSAEVRAKAARALGRLGAEEAAEELRRALDDRIPFVRATAAHALGTIGDREAVPALLVQARLDGFDPAQAAARALARIDPAALWTAARDPEAGPYLAEAADSTAVRQR